eukprot:6247028-Amphidinium_carterae.1
MCVSDQTIHNPVLFHKYCNYTSLVKGGNDWHCHPHTSCGTHVPLCFDALERLLVGSGAHVASDGSSGANGATGRLLRIIKLQRFLRVLLL